MKIFLLIMVTVILVLLVTDIITNLIFNIKLKQLEDTDETGAPAILVKYERKIHELQMELMFKNFHLEEAKNLIKKYEAHILAKEDCECSQKKD